MLSNIFSYVNTICYKQIRDTACQCIVSHLYVCESESPTFNIGY